MKIALRWQQRGKNEIQRDEGSMHMDAGGAVSICAKATQECHHDGINHPNSCSFKPFDMIHSYSFEGAALV
jgi:hypothetical protein